MRILHVTYQHSADDARILHKQCRSLSEAGHEVHLIAPQPTPKELFGVRFHGLSARQVNSKWRQLRIWFKEIEKYISQIKPNAVHLHDTALLLRMKSWRNQFEHLKFIYDVHEDHPRQIRSLTHLSWARRTAQSHLFARIEKRSRQFIDLFVTATPTIAALYPADRTITVRNLPRLSEFTPAAEQRSAHNLIYVGGLTRSRGLIEMIDAMMLLESADAKLILAGKFDSDETKQLAQSRPGWVRVDHRGWIDHAEVPELLNTAAAGLVVLHPKINYLDAWPVKLFEYLAAGLPFIASDFPAWKAMISDEGMEACGVFVDPLDEKAIAGAMNYVLQHFREAEAMGAAGRALIEREFNWEKETKTLLDAYERLAAAAR